MDLSSRTLTVPRGQYELHSEMTAGTGVPVVLMHGFPTIPTFTIGCSHTWLGAGLSFASTSSAGAAPTSQWDIPTRQPTRSAT